MALRLRTAADFPCCVSRLPLLSSRNLPVPRTLYSIAFNNGYHGYRVPFKPSISKRRLCPTALGALYVQTRAYSPSASPTAPTADNLTRELQGLYEIAKALTENARDSTNRESIYATSDRESARDAIEQFVTVYELYTTGEKGAEMGGGDGATEAGQPDPIVDTNFDAATIPDTVRSKVKEGVGQRVLELKSAVEALEEKAREN